ncbi:MAG: hypothetical protein JWO03_2506 [Bacteroidetes bacterium]|nr:hypothetical protein [Bacteroidota bacterium]
MRSPSDELFSLIKSLTPNEKRYFKIWASKHVVGKSNHYEKLFDAIDILPDDQPYDEAAFKKTLRGKSYGKYLRDEKTNLKEILLKAMRVYHAERTTEGRLSEMLQEIRFLYSKGLIDSCQSLIDKAYKLADERQYYEVKLQLIRFMRLTDISAYDSDRVKRNDDIHQKSKEILLRIGEEMEVSFLREKIYHSYYNRQLDKEADEVIGILEQLDRLEGSEEGSLLSIETIANTRAVILESKKQYTMAAELYKSLILTWDKYEWMKEEYPSKYERVIRNCLIQTWRAEKFEDMPPLLERMKNIQATDTWIKANILIQYWQLSMVYYLNTEKYKEAYKLLPELVAGIAEYGSKLPFQSRINLMSNMCIVYLKNIDYKGLLRTIHSIHHLIGKREEYSYALYDIKFMEFIAQFETNQADILDNLIRSALRFFKEHKLNSEYSDWLWKQMRVLASTEYTAINKMRVQLRSDIHANPCPDNNQLLKELIVAWL